MKRTEGLEFESKAPSSDGFVVAGAGLLAVLAESCCILPLALALIGIGGSWVSLLGPFVEYRGFILFGVAGALMWAWFRIWRRWKSERSLGRSIAVAAVATVAFVAAASAPIWERQVAQSMWQTLVER